jgi:hypothetical protein
MFVRYKKAAFQGWSVKNSGAKRRKLDNANTTRHPGVTTDVSRLSWLSRAPTIFGGRVQPVKPGTRTILAMSPDDGVDESIEASSVFRSYGHLMSERERLAFRHIGATMKVTFWAQR